MQTNEPDETPETEAPEATNEADADLSAVQQAVAAAEARAAEVEAKLRETEGRLRAVSKAYTDQKAEMAAFRERVEAQDKVKLARKEFEVVQTFFDPVQNLTRSLEALGDDDGPLAAGLRMIQGQFHEGLAKLGLADVPGVGAPFDPAVHEALAVTPVADPEQDGRVVMVHEGGFMVNGRALRPAKVIVGKHDPNTPAAEA